MSISYRQRRRLRHLRRALWLSEPRVAAMLSMFSRLSAGEAMPAQERVRRRVPGPVRALARAVWAVLCLCGRGAVACGRLLRPLTRPLWPCGRLLRRIALSCLIRFSFLPAGFRLIAGSWLAAPRPAAPHPPTAHRGNG
jgi:hypothetical protein